MRNASDPKIARIMVNPRHKIDTLACSARSPLVAFGGTADDPALYVLRADADTAAEPFQGLWVAGQKQAVGLAFMPDDTLVVCQAEDALLKRWNLQDGGCATLGMGQPAERFAPSPDGKLIATVHKSNLRFWNAEDWSANAKHLASWDFKGREITSLAWAPDSRYVACGDYTGEIHVVVPSDAAKPEFTLANHRATVTSLAWRRDGALIASGSADKTVCVWRADAAFAGREELAILRGHEGPVTGLAWSLNGSLLVSGSANTLRLWAARGELLRQMDAEARVGAPFALSHDGRKIFARTPSLHETFGQRQLWYAAVRVDFGAQIEHDPRYADGNQPRGL